MGVVQVCERGGRKRTQKRKERRKGRKGEVSSDKDVRKRDRESSAWHC